MGIREKKMGTTTYSLGFKGFWVKGYGEALGFRVRGSNR